MTDTYELEQKSKASPVMLVSFERKNDPYYNTNEFTVTFHWLSVEKMKPRNYDERDMGITKGLSFDRLVIRGTGFTDSDTLDDFGTNIYQVSYDNPFRVELKEAEAMVKTLRKISNGIERLAKKFGRPKDFAQYVQYVMNVLKIKTIMYYRDENISSSYDDNIYYFGDVSEVRNVLHWVKNDNKTG
jgi:hypothetical protein